MERTLKGVVSMLCKKVDAASHTYESKSNLDGKLVVEVDKQRKRVPPSPSHVTRDTTCKPNQNFLTRQRRRAGALASGTGHGTRRVFTVAAAWCPRCRRVRTCVSSGHG